MQAPPVYTGAEPFGRFPSQNYTHCEAHSIPEWLSGPAPYRAHTRGTSRDKSAADWVERCWRWGYFFFLSVVETKLDSCALSHIAHFLPFLLGPQPQLTLAAALDPLSSAPCNVHLILMILDRILMAVFPEMGEMI